jgi:flagellar motility protein MotE (MotC chaperone)
MKKLLSLISLISVLNILAIGGMIGFLCGTGRLDKAKAQAITDILKKPGTPAGFREKIGDLFAPPSSTQPAAGEGALTRPSLAGGESILREGEVPPASAEERISFLRRVQEEERLRLQAIEQDLRNRQDLLVKKQAQVQAAQANLDRDKAALQKQLTEASTTHDGAGFQKTMALFEELKPSQIKDLLRPMGTDEAARYIAAMEPDQAARIIGEFKTGEEKEFVATVMERLRAPNSAVGTGAASGSATKPATTMPIASAPTKAGP